MNILLINHYAGSPAYGMEYRPFYMAREWVRMGHRVTIVGADFSHLRSRQPDAGIELVEGIRYVWLSTPAYQGNGIGRVRNMLSFVRQLFFRHTYIVGENLPDVVIASSTYPLDIYPATALARKYQAQLVYEVHDLWPLSPMELGGMSKYHPFIMVMQKAEDYAYHHVDRVVSLLPKAELHMLERGLPVGKFQCVPNGIAVEEWYMQQAVAQGQRTALQKLRKNGVFMVLYAGAHGIANALKYLILAAELLKNQKIGIVLLGNGQEKSNLQQLVAERHIQNVSFLPAVGKNCVPDLLNFADVLYIGLQRQPLFRFGVSPNKMFDYMMAEKPIISAIDAGNDLVAEAGCGISIPAGDSEAIAEAICQMRALTADERAAMGKKGKAFVLAHHDYKVLAARFLDEMKTYE